MEGEEGSEGVREREREGVREGGKDGGREGERERKKERGRGKGSMRERGSEGGKEGGREEEREREREIEVATSDKAFLTSPSPSAMEGGSCSLSPNILSTQPLTESCYPPQPQTSPADTTPDSVPKPRPCMSVSDNDWERQILTLRITQCHVF